MQEFEGGPETSQEATHAGSMHGCIEEETISDRCDSTGKSIQSAGHILRGLMLTKEQFVRRQCRLPFLTASIFCVSSAG